MTRTRRRFAACSAIAVLVIVLAACGGDDDSASGSKSTTPKVYTEQDTEITVAKGEQFVIELPATPSTGYSWSAQDDDLVSLEGTTQVRGGSAPGAPGTQRMTFRAEATGATTLVLDYARPFEPGVPPAETASFDVTVSG
jgi:inhibitor of cysteine peptidase